MLENNYFNLLSGVPGTDFAKIIKGNLKMYPVFDISDFTKFILNIYFLMKIYATIVFSRRF